MSYADLVLAMKEKNEASFLELFKELGLPKAPLAAQAVFEQWVFHELAEVQAKLDLLLKPPPAARFQCVKCRVYMASKPLHGCPNCKSPLVTRLVDT